MGLAKGEGARTRKERRKKAARGTGRKKYARKAYEQECAFACCGACGRSPIQQSLRDAVQERSAENQTVTLRKQSTSTPFEGSAGSGCALVLVPHVGIAQVEVERELTNLLHTQTYSQSRQAQEERFVRSHVITAATGR
eukprot:6207776-Pleurochrysis_carterae.AAC.1